jgi:DNA-binding transcriptional LysR family regulator
MFIRHLPYFIVAAEEENLGRAAERLGMSASALTRRIQSLEHELGGVQLFERRQSGISLTAAGRAFRDDVEAPLDLLNHAAQRAERVTKEKAGALRVGINPIALRQDCLRSALAAFRVAYPDIHLELVPMMSRFQADALRVGDLDAAILSVPFADDGFGVEMIESFPMLLTLAKEHCKAEKADLSLADFEGEQFVGISRAWIPGVYDAIAAQFERAGVEQRIICETHCDATIANLIGLGVGVGFVTPAHDGTPSEGLRQRVLEDFDISLPLSLVWRDRGDAKIGKLVTRIGDAVAAAALQ